MTAREESTDPVIDVEFVDNTSQRTPCVLVLDGSGSMQGERIAQLNAGLKLLEETLKRDETARLRVQVLVIRFGGDDEVRVMADWTDAIDFTAPVIAAAGRTPLGAALTLALDKIEDQKRRFRANGIAYTRPWLFIISDGEPTDDCTAAAARCRQAVADKKVMVYPIGVGDFNVQVLGQFSGPAVKPMKLVGLKFRELFVWLSQSMSAASQSKPGQGVQVPVPTMLLPT